MKIIKKQINPIAAKNMSIDYRSNNTRIREFFAEYYPLLSVLIGYLLVATAAGPYQNGDTAWEYDSVLGVLTQGLPVANGGYLIDQPPLGFYLQASFAKVFGLSISNGTFLVTLFGLGSIILVYLIGRMAYNKTTGVLASLLFALNPWNIVISRSFLIDVPCLFFSLLSIFVGLIALRRGSLKLFVISGIVFALAFSTKLYAVFALIPIIAALFYYRPRTKGLPLWLTVFFLPTVVASLIWYNGIAKIGVLSIFIHPDLYTVNPNPMPSTYLFSTDFLVSYGLGWLFVDAVVLSLVYGVFQRRVLRKFFFFDLISLLVIAVVLGVSTWLGATLDLNAPFMNSFKYDYQALPFFCFLAASLASKSSSLLKNREGKRKLFKAGLVVSALSGFILLAGTVYYNMHYTQMFTSWDYLLFRVEPSSNQGYSLFNYAPIPQNSPLTVVQIFGFVVAISGVIWMARHQLAILQQWVNNRKGLIRL